MPGKFDMSPEWAEYFWEQVVMNGTAEDREEEKGTVSYVSIQSDDVRRFPELSGFMASYPYLKLWEDERGFVYCEFASEIPEPTDADLSCAEEGGTTPT